MKKLIYLLLLISIISFVLNLIWENLQAPLYQGYGNFWQHLSICSVASLGDVLIILVLYFILVMVNKNIFWITKISKSDIILVVTLGFLIAVGIEKWALMIGRWQYTEAMPMVPLLDVGLTPLLQMMLLPLLIFSVVSLTTKSK